MTLLSVPAWKAPTVSTAVCIGSTRRETTAWYWITAVAAMTTGSAARCGRRAMATAAANEDVKLVGAGHAHAATAGDGAGRLGVGMERHQEVRHGYAVGRVQAVGHHRAGAGD